MLEILSFQFRFPLYLKGREKYQFHYGVYLLNKDIAQVQICLHLNEYFCGLYVCSFLVYLHEQNSNSMHIASSVHGKLQLSFLLLQLTNII